MQAILGEDLPYIPLYTPLLIEAVRTDRFQGWVPMLEGIGNRWSFCRLRSVRADGDRGGA
jgi:ABC-type transport system substrate-binding protein